MKYKPVTRTSKGNFKACAMVGNNSVSLGWTVSDKEDRSKLLGFAIKKTEKDEQGEVKQVYYLEGQKRFKAYVGSTNLNVSSEVAPFQRFRWNDYDLKKGHTYTYEIFPMIGTPLDMVKKPPLVLKIKPSDDMVDGLGIYSNKGVTAAKNYFEAFGDEHPRDAHNNAAYVWLSNGMREALLNFIDQSKKGDQLHVSIYEMHDEDILKLLKKKSKEGVEILILYHFKGDKASHENHELIEKYNLLSKSKERTAVSSLSHNKFIVHLRNNKPLKLWTGTANFSEAGFHYQTNVGFIIEHKPIVKLYESYFQIILKNDPRLRKKEGRIGPKDEIQTLVDNAKIKFNNKKTELFFSPVRGVHILEQAKEMIKNAKSSVFISAPFGLDTSLSNEINANKDKVLEYMLVSHTSINRLKKKLDTNNNTRLFKPTKLGTYMGVRWDAKAFGSHKIHAKYIVVDAWTRNPKVLVGSANFSDESCQKNDENAFYIEGDKRLAACLTTEFVRMFDHYKSRAYINKFFKNTNNKDFNWLTEDGSWTDIFFKENSRSHKFRDREIFSGL